jgi:hypothetical protein
MSNTDLPKEIQAIDWEQVFDNAQSMHLQEFISHYSKKDEPRLSSLNGEVYVPTEWFSGAWPITEVLAKLIEASDILLKKKDYDGHGWEEIHHATNRAKGWLEKITLPKDTAGWVSVEDRPLVTYNDKGHWEATEDGDKDFIAAVPYAYSDSDNVLQWWIRHCRLHPIAGLCQVIKCHAEPVSWDINDVTHWQPLPQPPLPKDNGQGIK